MSAAPQSPKPPLRHPVRHHLAALALTALLVGVLAGDAAPSPVLTGLAATGLFVYAATSLPDMSLKAQSFVLLSVALAGVTALLIPDAAETVLRRATAGAAFVAALYASLGFLRDAAETSPLVRRCGQWLAAQPPGAALCGAGVGLPPVRDHPQFRRYPAAGGDRPLRGRRR